MSKRTRGETGRVERILRPVLVLPRAIRVVICAVIALMTALVLTPLVDWVYVSYFFSPSTVIIPALISSGVGMAMYAVGWWLLVGTMGENPQPRPALVWYLGVATLIVVTALVLFFTGLAMLDAPVS